MGGHGKRRTVSRRRDAAVSGRGIVEMSFEHDPDITIRGAPGPVRFDK